MAFSMHSHSGQFCPGHAKDTLEEVVRTAIARGMKTFALTEHMPRESDEDLYPEEIAADQTISLLPPRHALYLDEAVRLREKYAGEIALLVGFEGEWIRSSYAPFVLGYARDERVDFFIGSVHHVHGVPIDYDRTLYQKAVAKSTGQSEEGLFGDYYDAQYEMLLALRPKVVGHFDLIRLFSGNPDAEMGDGKRVVWDKIVRNLELIKGQGGLLEVNSAGLRKSLGEPYPGRGICSRWIGMGGRFTLSDDSHGVEQVGTNYSRMLDYLEGLGVVEVWTLERAEGGVRERRVGLGEVRASFRE